MNAQARTEADVTAHLICSSCRQITLEPPKIHLLHQLESTHADLTSTNCSSNCAACWCKAIGERSSKCRGGGWEGYLEASGVHLGVSKALHGILLAIMALYWNLDLVRLQAVQIDVYPLLETLKESFQDDWPAVEILNKLGPQVTCLKPLFGQV